MQLVPRYLVSNRTNIVANEAGFVTEYRPVYKRHLQVYKGIDNVLEFKLLNADQKPINLDGYTPKFQAFDENKNLIIEHDGVSLQQTDSSVISNKGIFSVTITDNDLLNIKDQFLSYNIHLINSNNEPVVTYTDTHFGNNGVIHISSEAFPGPKATYSVSTFQQSPDGWVSESVTAEPSLNGNEALHTAVIYTSSYTGNISIQATLDNQVTGTTNWAEVSSLTFSGTETEPTSINFNGVYSNLRFVSSADPSNTVSKILVRN